MWKKNLTITKGKVTVSLLIIEATAVFLVESAFGDLITESQRVYTHKAMSESQPQLALAQTSLPVLLFSLQMPQTRCSVQSQRHVERVIKQLHKTKHISLPLQNSRGHTDQNTLTHTFVSSSSAN